MSVWVMLSTAGSLREAERIAKTLVEEKLAACATLLPGALSYFFWEGKLSREKGNGHPGEDNPPQQRKND